MLFVVSSSVFLRVTSRAGLYKSSLAKVSNDDNGCPNEMGTLPDCDPNSIKVIEDSSAKIIEPLSVSFVDFPLKVVASLLLKTVL